MMISSKAPNQNGVLKARAIVAHSKHYLGDSNDMKAMKETKIRISEARDPTRGKVDHRT